MNDRMSDMDSLVDVAARAIDEGVMRYVKHESEIVPTNEASARWVLEAVGLPALLERVEAAEGEVARLTQINHSFIATPTGDMHDLIADRDALAAKVADAWDEGWEHAEQCQGCDIRMANPYRAALDASETP